MRADPISQARPLDHLALCGAPDAVALVLRSGPLSYQALNARVGLLAAWLATQVPESGARVATWLPKSELACLMPLAAVRAGLVHVPINPMLKRAQVAHILADSGAQLLISNAVGWIRLSQAMMAMRFASRNRRLGRRRRHWAARWGRARAARTILRRFSTPADRPASPKA